MVDFYVVPDYADFLGDCVDKKFSRYCKQEYTQHQFIFESVEQSEHFPLGCRTTYRAYSANEVVEIKREQNSNFPQVNLVPYQVNPVRTYPLPIVDTEGNEVIPAGEELFLQPLLFIFTP